MHVLWADEWSSFLFPLLSSRGASSLLFLHLAALLSISFFSFFAVAFRVRVGGFLRRSMIGFVNADSKRVCLESQVRALRTFGG